MKKILFLICFLFSLNIYAFSLYNLNNEGVIVDGYDVVSYFALPAKGNHAFQVKKDNVTYLFANQKNKDLFSKDPSKYRLQFDSLASEGYDVVDYVEVKLPTLPLKGKPDFEVKDDNVKYWFANQENKNLFIKNPSKYKPQFGGYCAYAVAVTKSKVDISPQNFVIQDNRLLLFYNSVWGGDALKKWLHTKSKNPQQLLKDADQNWTEVKLKEI